MGLQWEAVRTEFEFDGSWRDIYVLGTDLTDWQRMLDSLRASAFEVAYYAGHDEAVELPASAAEAFPRTGEHDRLLTVRFGGVGANCHFFLETEIEWDIDPREVTGQRELDALVAFMQALATAVGKDVVLTPENLPQTAVLRACPSSVEVEYHPFGGFR